MPPFSELEVDVGGPSCPPSATSTNSSPTSSCISLDALEGDQYKFALPPPDREDDDDCDRTRKVVTFDNQRLHQVKYIEPITEWTEDERIARWLSQEDYGNFRRDVFHTLYQLRNHPETIDGVLYSIRGVECRDPAIIGKRQRYKQAAWQAVFGEQEARRNGDAFGEQDWMATLYSSAAKPSVLEALDLAALDELEVKEIYRKDNPSCGCGAADVDPFSDDWIRCGDAPKDATLTVAATTTTTVTEQEEDCGFCVFGAPSGFDDAWLRGD